MTACEKCWTEASWRALKLGGVAADHYRQVLAENDGNPEHVPPSALTEAEDERQRAIDAADDASADQDWGVGA